jgi:transcriptional regulator with XRE-family HTH domain
MSLNNAIKEWREHCPLRNWRKKHHHSMAQLAHLCHVSHQAVALWEYGQRSPTLDNFISVRHYTGITIEEWEAWIRERPDGKRLQTEPAGERQDHQV